MNKRQLKYEATSNLDRLMEFKQFTTLIRWADVNYMRNRAIEAIQAGETRFAIGLLIAAEVKNGEMETESQR